MRCTRACIRIFGFMTRAPEWTTCFTVMRILALGGGSKLVKGLMNTGTKVNMSISKLLVMHCITGFTHAL